MRRLRETGRRGHLHLPPARRGLRDRRPGDGPARRPARRRRCPSPSSTGQKLIRMMVGPRAHAAVPEGGGADRRAGPGGPRPHRGNGVSTTSASTCARARSSAGRPDGRRPDRGRSSRSSGSTPDAGEIIDRRQAGPASQSPRRHPAGIGLRARGPQATGLVLGWPSART